MVNNVSVTGKTSDRIDQLLESVVVSGQIRSNNFYLTKKDGSEEYIGIVGGITVDDLDLLRDELEGEFTEADLELKIQVQALINDTAQQIGLDIEASKVDAVAEARVELNAAHAQISQDILDAKSDTQTYTDQQLALAATEFEQGLSELNDRVDLTIKSYTSQYAISESEATAPTSGWSESPPVRLPGEFIWTRALVTYSDDSTNTTAPVLVTGNAGTPGVQGPPGPNGEPRYTWVRYADDASGTGMSDLPLNKPYIGLAFNKTTNVESDEASDYQWSKILGPVGSPGVPGPPGENGSTRFTWVKYADSPTSGMSDSPAGKIYMGLAYNKETLDESSNYNDYTWSLIQGPQGNQGVPGQPGNDGQPRYTWIKYADDSSGAGMSDLPAGKTYLGLAYNKTTITESPDPAQYTWSKIEGPPGDQGLPGPPGANGEPRYTWLKYADTPTSGMSDSPAGKSYMGLAHNQTTATESTTYTDYSWSLIRGANGNDGVSVSSVTPYFAKTALGASAPAKPTTSTPPPATWSLTEPTYELNTSLWRTERIGFSDASFEYTAVTKVSAYETAISALASANGKSKILFGSAVPGAATAGKPGDIYWRRSCNEIIGQYLNTQGTDTTSGNIWTEQGLSHQTIATLDMGKASVGELTGEFIKADAISAKHTITGALIQTSGTSQRGIKLSSTALLAYNSANEETFSIAASTGNVVMKGTLKTGSTIEAATLTGILQTNTAASRGFKISDTTFIGYKNTTPNQGKIMFSMNTTTGILSLEGEIKAGSTISGALLTGPVRTREPTPGNAARVEISNTGLAAYNASGQATFSLSGADGSITMNGALASGSQISGVTITGGLIQTAANGRRITLNHAAAGEIRLHSNDTELSPARIVGMNSTEFGGLGTLWLFSPRTSAAPTTAWIALSSGPLSPSIRMSSSTVMITGYTTMSNNLQLDGEFISQKLPQRFASGTAEVFTKSGQRVGTTLYVPYPSGRFNTSPTFPRPKVVVTPRLGSPDYFVTLVNPEPDHLGFRINISRYEGTAGSVFGTVVDWVAFQPAAGY